MTSRNTARKTFRKAKSLLALVACLLLGLAGCRERKVELTLVHPSGRMHVTEAGTVDFTIGISYAADADDSHAIVAADLLEVQGPIARIVPVASFSPTTASVALTAAHNGLRHYIIRAKDQAGRYHFAPQTVSMTVDIPRGPLAVPASSEWTDHGLIFGPGTPGAWDRLLWGGFAGSVVKRNGTFYLYYQGAREYDEANGTVTFRAIGVATSPDGRVFSKHAGNPVIRWLPSGGIEEGAASAGATLDPAGNVALYYGANRAVSGRLVEADGRLAISSDGVDFADQGVVLDHGNPNVWGSGDELFPVLAFSQAGQWFVYYLPNGSPHDGTLGVAWGDAPDELTTTAGVSDGSDPLAAWGMAGSAPLDASQRVVFVSRVRERVIEAWTVDVTRPDVFHGPVETYAFDNMSQGTVFFDPDTDTWYLFYRLIGGVGYGLRTAPARHS